MTNGHHGRVRSKGTSATPRPRQTRRCRRARPTCALGGWSQFIGDAAPGANGSDQSYAKESTPLVPGQNKRDINTGHRALTAEAKRSTSNRTPNRRSARRRSAIDKAKSQSSTLLPSSHVAEAEVDMVTPPPSRCQDDGMPQRQVENPPRDALQLRVLRPGLEDTDCRLVVAVDEDLTPRECLGSVAQRLLESGLKGLKCAQRPKQLARCTGQDNQCQPEGAANGCVPEARLSIARPPRARLTIDESTHCSTSCVRLPVLAFRAETTNAGPRTRRTAACTTHDCRVHAREGVTHDR